MDREAAREFRDRWRAVAAIEAEERRMAPLALRWAQLNAAFQLGLVLEMPRTRGYKDEASVRQRWIRLKERQS